MENDEQALITAFRTNQEYFKILREQRLNSALAEPEVINLILNNAKGNVLDAGCGEGAFIKWISRKAPRLSTYGVDISEIGIKMAKEGRRRHNFEVQEIPAAVLRRSIGKLGFKIEYFSTRTHLWKGDSSTSLIKKLSLRSIGHMNFFPFNHLGPTTIIMGSKS